MLGDLAMRSIFVLLIFLNLNKSFALDIDEKLTLRFLKVSLSKKTVLVNRGAEDGLAMGDHAKFFVTTGVIARGVVEKVSPSRSVWSLYRVVDPAEISDGKVLNLKISSPVKITEDPTKSMKDEQSSAGSEKMNLNDASIESESNAPVNSADQKELEGLGIEDKPAVPKKENSTKTSKSRETNEVSSTNDQVILESANLSNLWEVWGTFYINSLSGTVSSTDSATTGSTAVANSTVDFSVGLERYFYHTESFLKNVSLKIFLHKKSIESGQDIKVMTNYLEYGGGLNYHFLNSPGKTNRLIAFGSLDFGIGSATETDTVITNGVSTQSADISGTNKFYSFGVGAKYILNNGFGAKVILDYFNSSESFNFPGSIVVQRSLSGPRVQLGLSYRF
jgi:hypothetical protein